MPSRIIFEVEDTVMDDAVDTTEVEAVKVSRKKFVCANVEANLERRSRHPTPVAPPCFNNMWLNRLALNVG